MKNKRELPEFAGYYATEDGHIINPRGHQLAEHLQDGRRLVVTIGVDCKTYCRSVARLVAEAWLGVPTGSKRYGSTVSHIDGDPLNNSIENLTYEKKIPVWCKKK